MFNKHLQRLGVGNSYIACSIFEYDLYIYWETLLNINWFKITFDMVAEPTSHLVITYSGRLPVLVDICGREVFESPTLLASILDCGLYLLGNFA